MTFRAETISADQGRESAGDRQLADVVFTGFGPFGDAKYNPSADAAEAAAAAFGAGAVARILDVTFDQAKAAPRQLRAGRLVVSIGLGRPNAVRVESTAKNARGATADNAGCASPGLLEPGGPGALLNTLGAPDGPFFSKLAETCAFPVEPSEDAGDYVCNATLYHLSRARDAGGPECVFVHVPAMSKTDARTLGGAVASAARAWLDENPGCDAPA